ncbi:LOW QUALITY PROTEIN: hypothetical protein U0070_026893, partial [Myodes glareolus]
MPRWYSRPQAASSSFHEPLEVPPGYASVSAVVLTIHSLLWRRCLPECLSGELGQYREPAAHLTEAGNSELPSAMPSGGLVSTLHGDGQKEVERGGLAFLCLDLEKMLLGVVLGRIQELAMHLMQGGLNQQSSGPGSQSAGVQTALESAGLGGDSEHRLKSSFQNVQRLRKEMRTLTAYMPKASLAGFGIWPVPLGAQSGDDMYHSDFTVLNYGRISRQSQGPAVLEPACPRMLCQMSTMQNLVNARKDEG